MVDPLTKLAISYGTDKFGYHDYTPNYFHLFKHLRDKPIRLLEIGVGGYQDADRGGESLEVWRDFFPKGQILGIDIQEKEMDLGDRVTILQGSQIDPEFLADLVHAHGPFDIIIDDGSHQNAHVITSFDILFPTLKPGGIYVVEDVQTSFFPRFGGSLDLTQPNSVGHFAKMARATAPATGIRSIERFHNMIALEKTSGAAPTDPFGIAAMVAQDTVKVLEIGAPDTKAATQLAGALDGCQITGSDRAKLTKKTRDLGPFDVVINHGKSDFSPFFKLLNQGGTYISTTQSDPTNAVFDKLFVDIDHREIRVNFPDADIHDLASEVYSLKRANGMTALVKGDNDYPSNFGFNYESPLAIAAFKQMETVLNDTGRERGFLLFIDIMTRAGDENRARKMLAKLADLGAISRSYYNVAVRQNKIDKNWDGAMRLLLAAVKIYPDDYRIRSQLGSIYSKEKNWQKAEREFLRAIELAPRDPLLRIQMANALSRLDRKDEAVASASVAIELVPLHAGHRVQLGRLQADAGQFDHAVETLQKAIDLDPDAPNAHRQLSRALFEIGQTKDALDAIARALLLNPKNQEYARWQDRIGRVQV